MAKKGDIDNNALSKESAAFIYKTEKRQRNLWVSLVKRIGRICTEKGCAHYPCKLPVFLLVYLLGLQISVPINPFFV